LQHDDVIACTLQILDHLPGGNADDSRYVLTDDAMRPKLPDNAEHFRPQKPLVFFSALLSGHGKRLAGESSGYNVNCSQTSGPLIKPLLCQGPDIPPARDVRPVLFEHRCRIIRQLALPDGRKTGPLGRKIKAAD
jgi:hypothetical protein